MSEPVILLVEDNPLDVELTFDAFRQAGLASRLEVARTGEKALDYLLGRGQHADRERFPLPQLVLLDLKLPGLSGHDVLARIKRHELLKRLPVVVLTSSRDATDVRTCYENGANSFLVKPARFADFVEVVRSVGAYWLSLNVGPPLHARAGPD